MTSELQQQLAAYLASPAVGEQLGTLAGICGANLVITDSNGELLHRGTGPTDEGTPSASLQLPLAPMDQDIGFLEISGCRSEEQLALLGEAVSRMVLEQVNHDYELDNLSTEILSKYEELNVLYDVGQSLNINMNQEEISRLALEKVQQVVDAGKTVLLLRDNDQPLVPVTQYGFGDQGFDGDPGRAQQLVLATYVADGGKALLADHRESFPDDLCQLLNEAGGSIDNLWPILAAPMMHGEKQVGVLLATEKGGGQIFTANDLKLVLAICSQAAAAINNLQMVEALKKTEALKREMDIARNIQMKMLPSAPLSLPGMTVAGRCVTAANVGGDYYDHILLEEGGMPDGESIHLLIADVSGHDVGAALMMSVGRKVFHTAVRRNLDPGRLMREFNSVMHDDLSSSDLFITMFYAQYRHADRSLRFSNAGHNPPFLVRAADGAVEELDADGIIIGVLDDMEFENCAVAVQPGDLVIFYTDGVTEAEAPGGEQYGLERFHRLLQENRTTSPEALLDIIYQSVDEYAIGSDQYDDITVMILKSQD